MILATLVLGQALEQMRLGAQMPSCTYEQRAAVIETVSQVDSALVRIVGNGGLSIREGHAMSSVCPGERVEVEDPSESAFAVVRSISNLKQRIVVKFGASYSAPVTPALPTSLKSPWLAGFWHNAQRLMLWREARARRRNPISPGDYDPAPTIPTPPSSLADLVIDVPVALQLCPKGPPSTFLLSSPVEEFAYVPPREWDVNWSSSISTVKLSPEPPKKAIGEATWPPGRLEFLLRGGLLRKRDDFNWLHPGIIFQPRSSPDQDHLVSNDFPDEVNQVEFPHESNEAEIHFDSDAYHCSFVVMRTKEHPPWYVASATPREQLGAAVDAYLHGPPKWRLEALTEIHLLADDDGIARDIYRAIVAGETKADALAE
jgi:hypothetical protein